MIVGPAAKTMAGYPRTADADPTKPYVMWPESPYEHLVVPVNRAAPSSSAKAMPGRLWRTTPKTSGSILAQ
jgi:hypothetical protein